MPWSRHQSQIISSIGVIDQQLVGGFLGWALFGKDLDEGALQPAGVLGSIIGAIVVLAIVLGDNAEAAFRQAMLFSAGDMRIFFATPLVGSITGLAFFLLFWPLLSLGLAKLRRR